MVLAAVAEALGKAGLMCRGGFYPRPEDGVPAGAATIVLIGNAGPALWRAFVAQVSERERRQGPHPLDGWIRRLLTEVAHRFGAAVLFPFDGPPFYSFQRWAKRAEPVHDSPLGLLIHPDFGLWHAYRGALLFAERLKLPARDDRSSPCASCRHKPCLGACPVDAIRKDAYDVPACLAFLRSNAGTRCLEYGCRARRACPVGRDYRYEPAQAAFHMQGFLAAERLLQETCREETR